MLQVLQPDYPPPLASTALPTPAARAFGEFADAALRLPDPPARSQSARQLANSCRACCRLAAAQMPMLPVSRPLTALCRQRGLYSCDLLGSQVQSAAAGWRALHCILW